MSAIKNGIKELHCKDSFIWKRFKKSIAHNNSKLTCDVYHIQVLETLEGCEWSSLSNIVLKDAQVLHGKIDLEFFLCTLQRSVYGEGIKINTWRVCGWVGGAWGGAGQGAGFKKVKFSKHLEHNHDDQFQKLFSCIYFMSCILKITEGPSWQPKNIYIYIFKRQNI